MGCPIIFSSTSAASGDIPKSSQCCRANQTSVTARYQSSLHSVKPQVHAGPPGGGRWRSLDYGVRLSNSCTRAALRPGDAVVVLQVYDSDRCSRTNASTSSLLPLT